MAAEFEVDAWAAENADRFPDRSAEDVAAVLELWRLESAAATGIDGVVLAAPLQRHMTARGTGLSTNFALILTANEVVAVKFDARHQWHPIGVGASQFGKRVGEWPRGSVSVSEVEAGRMASGLKLAVPGHDAIPCRTPRLAGNPAAAALVSALGGTLP